VLTGLLHRPTRAPTVKTGIARRSASNTYVRTPPPRARPAPKGELASVVRQHTKTARCVAVRTCRDGRCKRAFRAQVPVRVSGSDQHRQAGVDQERSQENRPQDERANANATFARRFGRTVPGRACRRHSADRSFFASRNAV